MKYATPSELTRALIDVPSLTENEGTIAARLDELLSDLGLETRRLPVDDSDEERVSLLATHSEGAPRILLCSHIDTVPPFIESSEDSEWIYGRGACDAKGIIAAMIFAVRDLLKEGVRDVGLLLLAGEETDSIGAKRANEQLAGIGSELVIVGEPTELKFVRACKGTLTATARFRGRAAHSAYPELGDSAISKAARAIVAIDEAEWGSDAEIGEGTANVGVVRGGRKPNVIPDEASLEVMIRTVEPMEQSLERLREIVESHRGTVEEPRGTSPVVFDVPAGESSVTVGFGTDAPYLGNLGRRMLFGPGSIHLAHTEAEKVRKDDLERAREKYASVVRAELEASPES